MSDCEDKVVGTEQMADGGTSEGTGPKQCQKEEQVNDPNEPDPCDPSYAGGDSQERYRALCRKTVECKAFFKKLTECNERVNSRTKTEEKCVEEVIDYVHCVDHCAAKRFFPLLK